MNRTWSQISDSTARAFICTLLGPCYWVIAAQIGHGSSWFSGALSHFTKSAISLGPARESLAVRDHPGNIDFYFGDEAFADQASTTVKSLATSQRLGARIRSLSVQADTLDAYCDPYGLTVQALSGVGKKPRAKPPSI